jgi:hypothetical protein
MLNDNKSAFVGVEEQEFGGDDTQPTDISSWQMTIPALPRLRAVLLLVFIFANLHHELLNSLFLLGLHVPAESFPAPGGTKRNGAARCQEPFAGSLAHLSLMVTEPNRIRRPG